MPERACDVINIFLLCKKSAPAAEAAGASYDRAERRLFAAAARKDIAQPALFDDAVSGGEDERRITAIQYAVKFTVPAEAESEQYDEKSQTGIVAESSETVH